MTVEKVGDRGFVDADLEQRLDVRPVLGPIGQQLEDCLLYTSRCV